jgi:hypothetical protein
LPLRAKPQQALDALSSSKAAKQVPLGFTPSSFTDEHRWEQR